MEVAIQIRVFTASAEVPKNGFMRKFCLTHLKKFHLRSGTGDFRDRYRRQGEAAGQEYRDSFALRVAVFDPPQSVRETSRAASAFGPNGLTAEGPALRSISRDGRGRSLVCGFVPRTKKPPLRWMRWIHSKPGQARSMR